MKPTQISSLLKKPNYKFKKTIFYEYVSMSVKCGRAEAANQNVRRARWALRKPAHETVYTSIKISIIKFINIHISRIIYS